MTTERGLLTHLQQGAWSELKEALTNKEVSFDFKTPGGAYDDCACYVAHWNLSDLDKQIADSEEVPYLYDGFPDEEGVLIQKGEMADGFYGYQIMAYDLIDMIEKNNGDLNVKVKAFDDMGEAVDVELVAKDLRSAPAMKL